MTQDRYAEKAMDICGSITNELDHRNCMNCKKIADFGRECAADALGEAIKTMKAPPFHYMGNCDIVRAIKAKSKALREQGEKP